MLQVYSFGSQINMSYHICRLRRTYLPSSEDTFFNKSPAFLWTQTVPLSLSIISYTAMKQNLYKTVSDTKIML
jgi:hypothetical protein